MVVPTKNEGTIVSGYYEYETNWVSPTSACQAVKI
jgi:hypothetical protein